MHNPHHSSDEVFNIKAFQEENFRAVRNLRIILVLYVSLIVL